MVINGIAVFPLEATFLPDDTLQLVLFEERYRALARHLQMSSPQQLVTVLIERGREVGGQDRRLTRGVLVDISHLEELPDGRWVASGLCTKIVDITSWLSDDPFPRADVEVAISEMDVVRPFDIASTLSLVAQQVRSLRHLLGEDDSIANPALTTVAAGRWWDDRVTVSELWKAYWLVARQIPLGALDRYQLLHTTSLPDGIFRLRRCLEHVRELAQFQQTGESDQF
jgi:hypothetical protein